MTCIPTKEDKLQMLAFDLNELQNGKHIKTLSRRRLIELVKDRIAFLEGSPSSDPWISCEERQPDVGDEYLVAWDLSDDEGLVSTLMEYDAKNKKWLDVINDGIEQTHAVKFWMEKPEPPKM